MELLFEPWPWYVAGPLIAMVMFLLLFFGGQFGMSSNLRTMCTIAGAEKYSNFFKIDVRKNRWNLVFVLGAILGGFISSEFLMNGSTIVLNPETTASLVELGFSNPETNHFLPAEIFGADSIFSMKGITILLGGGFLVGFGARYAGGCTSGHAISGLSNLQVPSLIAVVGFFIGGLAMTHFFLPIIF